MSHYQLFVLVTLGLVTLLSVILTIYFKKRLTNMAGMVIAMVIGMNVGLTSGVFLGLLYQGNLYYSTILSIAAGVIAGTACGFVMGVLPALEGFMAGLMGGMMGAMLGEMLTYTQAITIINIFLTLSVSSLLLFQILPKSSEKDLVGSSKKWTLKPIITFVVLGGYLFIGNQLPNQKVLSKSGPQSESHQNHGLSEEDKVKELTINVHPSHFSYDPQKIILKKDQQASIILKNNDSIDHDIEIKEILLKEKKAEHHHGHSQSEADFHLHAAANKQTKITFIPLQKGTFEFYCTIPGHKESGMTGTLIIQ